MPDMVATKDEPTDPREPTVSSVIGMFYKLVRNVVEDAVAVLDNRRQFQCQALLHFFGKRVSVNGLGIGIAHFHQFSSAPEIFGL